MAKDMSPTRMTEIMFAGSLIERPSRPGGLLSALRETIDPQCIQDDLARAIYRAALLATDADHNMPPTIDNIAFLMLYEGLYSIGRTAQGDGESDDDYAARTAEELAVVMVDVREKIGKYADVGAHSPNGMSSLAAALQDDIGGRNLRSFIAQSQQIVSDHTLTSVDLYDKLFMALEAIKPDAVMPRIYDIDDQIRVMGEMQKRQRGLLGVTPMTFPPEWWLNDTFLIRGLMYTLTGLTGRGKSSTLLQLADHLERCGFTVLYCHLEDDIERQMNRRARLLAHASGRELMAGDPRNKFKIVAHTMKQRVKNTSGKGRIIFAHCVGKAPSYVRMLQRAYKADVVIVDYLQKFNLSPYQRAQGRGDESLAAAADDMKTMAEDDQYPCVVVLGSQEAEHDSNSEYRKGTSGSRQIEHKSQMILEIERLRLTEADGPEIVDGITIAAIGELSGMGAMVVHKNNDGSPGRVEGVFHGLRQEFKAVEFCKWEEAHPGELFPLPVLREPDDDYYAKFEAKDAAWAKMWQFYDPVRVRRQKAKQEARNGRRQDDPF